MTDVVMEEYLLNPDGSRKVHPNGKTWCLGNYAIDQEFPAIPTAQGTCIADGTGTDIGENIRDYTLINCNGDPVDLHSRCGSVEALLVVASAGWWGDEVVTRDPVARPARSGRGGSRGG